jgi:hypothetical protein
MSTQEIRCPNNHPATLLYMKRVGEDTIICCAGCDAR